MINKLIQNKKALLGSEFILWFFRLVLLTIILAGVVLVVNSFYSKQYDVREVEANLLANQFADCLMEDRGVLTEQDIADVFDSCSLEFNSGENYVNITLLDKKIASNSEGNNDLEVWCKLEKKVRQEYPSSCVTSTYLVFAKDEEGKSIPAKLKIFVAVLKTEQNV